MSKKYRILVIDDSASARNLVSDMLISIGHIPCLAENYVDALEEINQHKPDLILLDIMMPEVSGFELLERLKSDSSLAPIPVIMISALNDAESIVRCVKLGAADYLAKPFFTEKLKNRIHKHLILKKAKISVKKVLVVEKSAQVRQMIKRTLDRLNIHLDHIEVVEDGESALKMLSNGVFDLIICDWDPPKIDGIGLLKTVRADPLCPEVPFLMMAHQPGKEKIMEAVKLGVSQFLSKPFNEYLLVEKINQALHASLRIGG